VSIPVSISVPEFQPSNSLSSPNRSGLCSRVPYWLSSEVPYSILDWEGEFVLLFKFEALILAIDERNLVRRQILILLDWYTNYGWQHQL
jgi:hypothetical protein